MLDFLGDALLVALLAMLVGNLTRTTASRRSRLLTPLL